MYTSKVTSCCLLLGEADCVRKERVIKSAEGICSFASFDRLDLSSVKKNRGCQACKVFRRGGEVAVLVPPMTVLWSKSQGICSVTVTFSSVYITATGSVRDLNLYA